MSANPITGRVYRACLQFQVHGGSGRARPGQDGDIKPVEFKVDTKKGKLLVEKEVPPEFVVKPRRQFVDEGQSAKFKASFEGSSSTVLTWIKDGRTVQEDATHKIYSKEDFYYLEISKVQVEDGGNYTCRIENSAGSSSAIAELEVFEKPKLVSRQAPPPSLVSPLHDALVHAGDRQVRLECKVKDAADCEVTWFRDGRPLQLDKNVRAMFDGSVATLVLREVEERDSGLYRAVIANSAGQVETECSLTVDQKLEPPVFVRELHDMEVDDGDKVELVVEVKGSQPVDVFWIFNNAEVSTQDSPFLQVANGCQHRLIIPRAGPQHVGEYVCEAYNDFGDTDTFCMLSVRALSPLCPPSFLEPPLLLTVSEGDASAVFRCRVAGDPPPVSSWEQDGRGLHSSHKYKISCHGPEHSLTIFDVGQSDAGRYTCHLENSEGTACHTTSLVVHGNQSHQTDFRSVLRARTDQARPRSLDRVDWRSDRVPRHQSPGPHPPLSSLHHHPSSHPPSSHPPSSQAPAPTGQMDFRGVLRRSGEGVSAGGRSKSQDRLDSPLSSSSRGRTPQTYTSTQTSARVPISQNAAVPDTASPRGSKYGASSHMGNVVSPLQSAEAPKAPSPHSSPHPHNSPSSHNSASLHNSPSHNSPSPHNPPSPHNAPSPLNPLSPHKPPSPTTNGMSKRVSPLSGAAQPARGSVVSRAARQFETGAVGTGGFHAGRREGPAQTARSFMAAREVFAAKPASGTGGNVQPPSENRSPSSRLVSRPAQSSARTGAAVSGIIPVANSACTQAPAVRTGAAVSGIIPMANPTGSQAPAIRTAGTKNSAGSSPALKTSSSSEQSMDSLRSSREDAPTFTPKLAQAGETSRPSRSPPRQETRDENDNLPVRESPPPTRKASPPQRDPPTPSQPTAKRPVTSDLPSRSVTSDPQSKLVTSDHPVTSDLRRRGSSDWRSRLSGRYEGRELPEIRRPLCDQCVRYGCRAILECEIAGVPRPDVSWTVNNRNIKVSRFFQMSYEDNKARLVIAEAFSEDEGEYTCTACNPSGTTQTSCHLTVEEPSSGSQSSHTDFEGPVSVRPQLLNLSSTNVSVLRGQPVEVNATFTGNPRPKVTWFKLKEEIQTDARVSVCSTEYTSTLVLATTVATDTGRYSVLVENCMGTDSAALSITVEDVPNAPMGQPHITAVTSTSVSLAWYGPAFDGGSQVTHYAVEVKDTGKGHWRELTSNCRSTSYEACGLGTDTEYVFRVRAGNKHGLGEPSTTSDPVMPRDHVHSDSESDGTPEVFSPGLSGASLADDTLPFEPRQVVISPDRQFEDHYTILNEVGKGKFGSVFRCKAKADDSEWAAKVIKVRPRERDAVLHEVDIMNQLAHPKLLLLRDAFSTTRSMTLVMEYIGGGELFERVISENFVLTERDCVHFMRQIVEGVNFMHSQSIMHLDLKPENILCISASSNQVKIIDFGLARYHRPGTSLKVMFGTPEFIAPEVVNYDEISPATDMWSLGVICYVLLSGLSPFLGDNDAETLANVTCGDFDFEDEAFDDISSTAKNFIESLLVKNKEKRLTMETCRRHRWLAQDERKIRCKRLNTDKLRCFMARRKWQKTGTAIRALGRLGLLQRALSSGSRSLRSESASSLDSKSPGPSPRSLDSDPSSPRPHSPPHLSTSLPKVNDDDEDEEGVDDRNSSARLDAVAATKGGNPSPRQGETTPGERLARREDPEPGETVLPLATPARAPPPLHCPVPNGDVTRTERGAAPPQNEAGGDRGARRRLRFEKRMLDCQAFKGDAVRFDVALSGPALPRVQWLLDGEAVEEDARHIRESDEERRHHSLIIRNVTDDDEGEYTCCARSDDGEVSCSADLVIVGSGAF